MFVMTPFEHRNQDIFQAFNDFENRFFGGTAAVNACKTDIQENDQAYLLEAEMPGFSKDEIHLDVDGDYLTISAEHTTENNSERDGENKNTYIRRERSYAAYKRSFNIANVDADHIEAAYDNGILKLTLPKRMVTTPAVRRIEIQ